MADAPRRKKLEKTAPNQAEPISTQKFYCCRCGTSYSRKKGYFPVVGTEIGAVENFGFSVIRETDIAEFDCFHNTTIHTAPATIPAANNTSERTTFSCL